MRLIVYVCVCVRACVCDVRESAIGENKRVEAQFRWRNTIRLTRGTNSTSVKINRSSPEQITLLPPPQAKTAGIDSNKMGFYTPSCPSVTQGPLLCPHLRCHQLEGRHYQRLHPEDQSNLHHARKDVHGRSVNSVNHTMPSTPKSETEYTPERNASSSFASFSSSSQDSCTPRSVNLYF